MPGGFILGYVLTGTPDLVMGPLVVAGGAGMPQGDVVSAGETVVLVIVVFVGVGRLCTAVAVIAAISGSGWNAARCLDSWWSWGCVVVAASSASATIVVASSTIVIVALVGGGLGGRRVCRHLYGEECDLLLGCCDGGTKFCNACDCRLVVGIIRDVEVGQLLIEGGLDVIECIVIGNDVGGAVVSVDAGGARARLLPNDVCSGEVRF